MVSPAPGTRVLVFDWGGPYGHFRKPYSSASPLTYPLPPPTAVAGLLGAIAGWDKASYWNRLARANWGLAIQVRHPVRCQRCGLNLLIVKGSRLLRPGPGAPHRPTPMEFLVDPSFRIFFWHEDRELFDEVLRPLEEDRTAFTPCLGLACCVASVTFVGCYEATRAVLKGAAMLRCAVPVTQVRRLVITPGARVARMLLPARMRGDRVVERYEELAVELGAQPIEVDSDSLWEVHGENCLFF